MAEMTQVSEQPVDVEAPRDRAPRLIAFASFVSVMLVGAGLILIELQVPDAVMKVLPWAVGIAFVLWLRWGVPSSKLPPEQRAQRDERRAGGIVGVMSACAVLGAMTAATYLTSWSQWLVLGSFVALTFAVGVMLHVRFTIGA